MMIKYRYRIDQVSMDLDTTFIDHTIQTESVKSAIAVINDKPKDERYIVMKGLDWFVGGVDEEMYEKRVVYDTHPDLAPVEF